MPTDAQRRATFLREVDPQLQAWLRDLSANGIDRSVPMSPINEAAVVSSGYGGRNVRGGHGDGAPPPTRNHEAIDYIPARNAQRGNVPIVAIVDARVLWVGTPDSGSGVSIMLGGADGRVYSYAHLEAGSPIVRAGQQISRGQRIGTMGDTGTATADCVHVVKRELDLGGRTFRDWSWANRAGALGDFIPPGVVSAALSEYRRGDSDHRITWTDFERRRPSTGWDTNQGTGSAVAANDQRDMYPHLYALREQQPHSTLLRGVQLSPTSTTGSSALNTLDERIERESAARRLGAAIAPPPPPPPRRAAPREDSTIEGWIRSFACAVTAVGAEQICAPPRTPSNGGRQRD